MSIQAMSYVLKESRTTAGERLVLLSLANHANDEGIAWPATQTIAAEARIIERSVRRALRELERLGEIEPMGGLSRGGRRATRYLLIGFTGWWASNVGPPTPINRAETPRNRTVTVDKRHERGPQRPNTRSLGPGTPVPNDTLPGPKDRVARSQSAGVPGPKDRVFGSERPGTPVFNDRIPGPKVPRIHHEPSLNPGNANAAPPTPPQAGGNGHDQTSEPVLFRGGGGAVMVWAGAHRRLMSQAQAVALAGSSPADYAAWFQRQGFRAEVVNAETDT